MPAIRSFLNNHIAIGSEYPNTSNNSISNIQIPRSNRIASFQPFIVKPQTLSNLVPVHLIPSTEVRLLSCSCFHRSMGNDSSKFLRFLDLCILLSKYAMHLVFHLYLFSRSHPQNTVSFFQPWIVL